MTSTDLTGSTTNQSEASANSLPKPEKTQSKSFARSIFQTKRSLSKHTTGTEKMTEEALSTTTTSAAKKHKGIRGIIRADSLKAKQSLSRLFGSESLKNDGIYLAADVLRSRNDDTASETSVAENTDLFKPISHNYQPEGFNSETIRQVLDADYPDTQNTQVPILSPESESRTQNEPDSSMPRDTEFLTAVDATLSYGQVDYAASGLPEINFAAVIYGDEGFSIAAPDSNKGSEPIAEKVPVPSAKTAYTRNSMQTRQRASSNASSGSEDTAVRTRIFSFCEGDDDSDQSSATDSSGDEFHYLSLNLPRTRIFKKKSKTYTTHRVRTSMPDLYTADPAEEQTIPDAAPVPSLTDADDLQPVKADTDGEENVAPLRIPYLASPLRATKLATNKIDIFAENCHHQLYESEEWTATEELFHEIESISTLTASAKHNILDLTNAGEIPDTVASNEDRFAEFAEAIEQCSANGDHEASEEADTLIDAVYGYKQVFCHLIKNIVSPGNDMIHNLLNRFFHLRSCEGELILEAERISRKLMLLTEEHETSDSAFKNKVCEVSSCLSRVEGRFKRCQSELARLETDFSKEIPNILVFISKTSLVRAQVLLSWTLLHTVSDLADLFDSFDVVNLIHKVEYEKMTSWYSNAAVGEFSLLLSTDLDILRDCSSMLRTMFSSLRTERDMLILVSHSLPNLG